MALKVGRKESTWRLSVDDPGQRRHPAQGPDGGRSIWALGRGRQWPDLLGSDRI
jgi:hypothetical protein